MDKEFARGITAQLHARLIGIEKAIYLGIILNTVALCVLILRS